MFRGALISDIIGRRIAEAAQRSPRTSVAWAQLLNLKLEPDGSSSVKRIYCEESKRGKNPERYRLARVIQLVFMTSKKVS